MLQRLISGTGKWKVDSGLNMLIEPIQFWLVASENYKKRQQMGCGISSSGHIVLVGIEKSQVRVPLGAVLFLLLSFQNLLICGVSNFYRRSLVEVQHYRIQLSYKYEGLAVQLEGKKA